MEINAKRWVQFSYSVASVLVFLTMRQVLIVVWDFFRLQEMSVGGVVSALDVGAVAFWVASLFFFIFDCVFSSAPIWKIALENGK